MKLLPAICLVIAAVGIFALTPIGGGLVARALGDIRQEKSESQPPSWLAGVETAGELATDRSYVILAGKLINLGLVDVSGCADHGMIGNGNASACGEIAARGAVILWQNQFDEQIFDAAKNENIPPFLLKNILATESQFWPNRHRTVYGYYEYGLGHITQMGADTMLRWNESLANQICGQVYTTKTCRNGYAMLSTEQQSVLRGAILRVVNADCDLCMGGVNLTQAKASIPVVAAAIKGNYNHTIWLLKEHTGQDPYKTFETSDLWRLTAASYNAGPGCMETALKKTIQYNLKPSWKTISKNFDEGCSGAIQYVENISSVDPVDAVNLSDAMMDTNKASSMVLENEFVTPTFVATIGEPTATPEVTETPFPENTLEATATLEPISDTQEPTLEILVTPTETETSTPEPTSTETPTGLPTVPNIEPTQTVESGETGDILVKFKPFVPSMVSDIILNLTDAETVSSIAPIGVSVIEVPSETVKQVIKDLNNNYLVEYAEPDYTGEMMSKYTPTDQYYGEGKQNFLTTLDIDVDHSGTDAWNITKGLNASSTPVVVAVIDTGVDTTSTELSGRVWVNTAESAGDHIDNDGNGYIDDVYGWNFVAASNDTSSDSNGHGTHAAGIIAANHDNSGVVGIAPEAKIMILKALDANGSGKYSDIASAITYAVDNGANVIQLGFGGDINSDALLTATNYAYDHNVAVVAAAGNSGTNKIYYPAGNPHVISVGALDKAGTGRASFSTFGDSVDVYAPGVDILSIVPGNWYGSWNGTSVSSAEVAGIVALLSSRGLTVNEIQEALFSTSNDLGLPGTFNNGIPSAFFALSATGIITPTPEPYVTTTPAVMGTPTPGNDVNIVQIEKYWASTQACDDYLAGALTITSPENSVIGPTYPDATEGFDTLYSYCDGAGAFSDTLGTAFGGVKIGDFAKVDGISSTSIQYIHSIELKTSFYIPSGWLNDAINLQISGDNGDHWLTIKTYDSATPPPAEAEIIYTSNNLKYYIDTPTKLDQFKFRIYGGAPEGSPDLYAIYLDQVSLEVVGNMAPSVTILTPLANANIPYGNSLSFTGTGYDGEDPTHNLTPSIVWTSNIDGLLGVGSPVTTRLTPGTHTITATVKDTDGITASSSITIVVAGDTGPHGGYAPSTDSCASCHRGHSAKSVGDLLNYPTSSHSSNDFCKTCHSTAGGAMVVETHGNKHFAGKQEDGFELLCIQCHEPHGNTTNMFMIRTILYDGQIPMNFKSMSKVSGTITFTNFSGANSFGNTSTSDSLCVACHLNYDMDHRGGADHQDGGDYTGQSCIMCHKHTLYTDIIEGSGTVRYSNGFMPVTPTPTP